MANNQDKSPSINQQDIIQPTNQDSTPKPPKPEDKPFERFIAEDFIPTLEEKLKSFNKHPLFLKFTEDARPIAGDKCWMVYGQLDNNKRFWICFSQPNLKSLKTISLAEVGNEPSLLESFLIDEKKITLSLLVSRTLQRLNGQKWLGVN